MSVSIRTCPGCDALILADTFQCPDCAHVFDEDKARKLDGATQLANAEVEDPCAGCGHMVRAGLVRCPECHRFMRDDIAQRYDAMRSTPQKIIYSDVPKDERTDFLPSRHNLDQAPVVMDAADDDGFELGGGQVTTVDGEDGGFELAAGVNSAGSSQPTPAQDARTAAARTVDAPEEETNAATANETAPADEETETKSAASTEAPAPDGATKPAADGKPAADLDADDLLDIAKQDEKETQKRKRQRRRKDQARSVLVPCACGAWMRVRDHQMGKVVRCRKCGAGLNVPQLLKKKADDKQEKKDVKLPWMKDCDHVTVDPGNLRLKAGSVAGNAAPVDVVLSENGIAIFSLTAKAKGSLFSKGKADSADDKRAAILEYLKNGGLIASAPSAKTIFVPADKVGELLIVQPVEHAHESMFAGVPVFGEGRVAIRIPAENKSGEQEFLSFGLTDFRFFKAHLERCFDVKEFGEKQGIPQDDKKSAHKCHYTGLILNALADTAYHEHDRHMELTLLGRKCGACGIAISEGSRKKQKIGGTSGRGIAKTKCPKCAGKFGDASLYAFELKDTAPTFDLPQDEESSD